MTKTEYKKNKFNVNVVQNLLSEHSGAKIDDNQKKLYQPYIETLNVISELKDYLIKNNIVILSKNNQYILNIKNSGKIADNIKNMLKTLDEINYLDSFFKSKIKIILTRNKIVVVEDEFNFNEKLTLAEFNKKFKQHKGKNFTDYDILLLIKLLNDNKDILNLTLRERSKLLNISEATLNRVSFLVKNGVVENGYPRYVLLYRVYNILKKDFQEKMINEKKVKESTISKFNYKFSKENFTKKVKSVLNDIYTETFVNILYKNFIEDKTINNIIDRLIENINNENILEKKIYSFIESVNIIVNHIIENVNKKCVGQIKIEDYFEDLLK